MANLPGQAAAAVIRHDYDVVIATGAKRWQRYWTVSASAVSFTHVEDVLPLLEGTRIRYYPFPGCIVGHPSILEGLQAEIVKNDAVALASHPGLDGLDYRSAGNVPSLIDAGVPSRAQARYRRGIGGPARSDQNSPQEWRSGIYHLGTSALNGRFPAEGSALEFQLRVISACVEEHQERMPLSRNS